QAPHQQVHLPPAPSTSSHRYYYFTPYCNNTSKDGKVCGRTLCFAGAGSDRINRQVSGVRRHRRVLWGRELRDGDRPGNHHPGGLPVQRRRRGVTVHHHRERQDSHRQVR
ncbi:unnamed protein product, partial [Ectocarpus sp. 12 AP-2014]